MTAGAFCDESPVFCAKSPVSLTKQKQFAIM